MALVEKFHVVAAEFPVASGQTIKEGQVVSLRLGPTTGVTEVVLQGTAIDGDTSSPYYIPYGIAGDTKSTTASSMPGVAAGWQNRASDYYDETKASGKMTVYHSGGEFATDMFQANVGSAAVLSSLGAQAGQLCLAAVMTTPIEVARLTQQSGSYPSGVPGVNINGDQALSGENTNTYIEFKLTI